jgi:uncharacterized protein (DUF1330 family)
MIVLTQLIYLHDGCEQTFQEFEAIVLPLLASHGCELMLRLRPDPASYIAGSCERPYELHLVRFPDDDALSRYANDDARRAFLHLKEASVRSTLVVAGQLLTG